MTDQLKLLRRTASEMRDLADEIIDLEEQVIEKKKQLTELERNKLPELFMEAGVNELTLAAEGNHPEVTFKLKPYYHANIAAGWAPEKRELAFTHLEALGYGDIIKRTYRIPLAKGDKEMATRLEKGLAKLGLTYSADLNVAHATLGKVLREEFESGRKKLDLNKIGGDVGLIVSLK